MKNRMTKRLLAVGITLTLSLPIVGCNGGKAAESQNITVDIVSLADKIVKEGSFKDEMNQLEDDQFEVNFEEIDNSLVNKSCAYMGTGATSEQVVIIDAKDSDSASKVKDMLHTKIENDITENEGYLPEEVKKLQSAVLEVKGHYAILVVSNDNSSAEKIVNKECK